MENGVTVIICTYNGALRLPKTIEHLARQSAIEKIKWEIILVDNASTDKSAEVAHLEWAKYQNKQTRFTIIKEREPGKIYALKRAFSLAVYSYSIICDDDNWLSETYVELMYNLLSTHPEIGAAGGQGIPVGQSPHFPSWFNEHAEGYAVGKQAESTSFVDDRGHLWGAGLGTRTNLYNQMYNNFPSLLVGRLGNQLTAGEDAEYCQRLLLKGYRLYYDESLIFHHYMPDSRLTLSYKAALFNGFIESNKILDKYYLINRLKLKFQKNRLSKWKLIFITPFRILFSRNLSKKQTERIILNFVYPFKAPSDPVVSQIRKFIENPVN